MVVVELIISAKVSHHSGKVSHQKKLVNILLINNKYHNHNVLITFRLSEILYGEISF